MPGSGKQERNKHLKLLDAWFRSAFDEDQNVEQEHLVYHDVYGDFVEAPEGAVPEYPITEPYWWINARVHRPAGSGFNLVLDDDISPLATMSIPEGAENEIKELIRSMYLPRYGDMLIIDIVDKPAWDFNQGHPVEKIHPHKFFNIVDSNTGEKLESVHAWKFSLQNPKIQAMEPGDIIVDEETSQIVVEIPEFEPVVGQIKWLNVYEVTRHYGGPHEGGWWYNHDEPLASFVLFGYMDAEKLKALLKKWYSWVNYGDLNSVSGGAQLSVQIDDEPASRPNRPYYS